MREMLLVLHRYSGLASLAFLALAALTGCILTLRGPIDRALNPDLFDAPTEATTQVMRIAAVESFAAAHPDLQVTRFDLNPPAGRTIPIEVAGKPGRETPPHNLVYLDPQTGAVAGDRSGGAGWDRRHFIGGVAELHFDLLAGTWGRWFLGIVAVLWFLSNIAGLVLTLPERKPFWKTWWRTWQFRRSSALPRLLLDLHRASGLWLFPVLLVLAFSSAALNFWGEVYEPAVTNISPLERDLFSQDAPFPQGRTPKLSFENALQAAEGVARADGLEWQPATMLYLPDWNLYGVKFSADGVLDYKRLGPVDYYVDGDSGAYRHKVDPYDDSAGLVMIRMIYPLHSGEIFGTLTVVVIFAAGLATFGQSATGLYVWWKKRKSRVAARRARAAKTMAGRA